MPSQVAGHELLGTRYVSQVGTLSADRMVQVWCGCASRVVKYGFRLQLDDLEPPRTGIFDGLSITIDPDVDFEMQCFILLHLFGHSVQWVAPSLADKLDALQHTPDKARFMQVLHNYEYEAARYGLQLLHETGVADLDRWYSDFVETDWRYVERFYENDVIPPWEECVTAAGRLVVPLAIPPLVHRRVEVRFAF
jgi:hypothetical protein